MNATQPPARPNTQHRRPVFRNPDKFQELPFRELIRQRCKAASEGLVVEDLGSRGICLEAAQEFGLGYHDRPHYGGVITMPYVARDAVVAVNYRLLTPLAREDGKADKTRLMHGSVRQGQFFGGQTLLTSMAARRLLFVVEGELNCVSVWQAGRALCIDAVSPGSESAYLPDRLIEIAHGYASVLVWADRPHMASKWKQALGAGACLASEVNGIKRDANDRLRDGSLVSLLVRAASRLPQTAEQREAWLWNAFDAANEVGVDEATMVLIRGVATELGRTVTWRTDNGIWFAA